MLKTTTDVSINQHLLDVSSIKEYLGSGLFRGIGKKTASKIVDCFGRDTLTILDSDISRLNEVKGIAASRITALKDSWELSKSLPYRAGMSFLLGAGLTLNLSLKICQYYGIDTVEVVQNNPYKLAQDLEGVGFNTADEIAMAVGHSPDSVQRHAAAIMHCLRESTQEGHCYLPFNILQEQAFTLLITDNYVPVQSKLDYLLEQLIAIEKLVEGEMSGSVYLPALYRTEIKVAKRVRAMMSSSVGNTRLEELEDWLIQDAGGEDAYHYLGIKLSPEQKKAILMAENHQISIITGGPGCGKTFTLKTLARRLKGRANIALAAPTGKAAKRLSNVTGFEAKTIHRLLEWSSQERQFCRTESNPLQADFVILDEASMVDIFLFNSLLKALLPTAKLVIVGDPDQLPSVGPGMVLRDLILSDLVPITRLTLIKRQQFDSGIVTAACQINQGITPTLPPAQNFESAEHDCVWQEAPSPESVASQILRTLFSLKDAGFSLSEHVQVLTPTKKGAAGTANLNALIQGHINPPDFNKNELRLEEVIWRVGDRVIQTRNDYSTGVMNGEEGKIVKVELENAKILVEFEAGVIVAYTTTTISDLVHSYAMTIHKSQGSEYRVVIIPVLMSHYRMLTRQILYTGITRAQYLFIGIGQQKALQVAANTDRPAQRYTQLAQLLVTSKLPEVRSPSSQATEEKLTSVQGRLRELKVNATKGQMTKIGSLALQLFELVHGGRPCKKQERVDGMSFMTYHYPEKAKVILDQAIQQVLSNQANHE